MKKGLLAAVMGLVLAILVVSPAFAAELNSNEQAVYDEFCAVVEKYRAIIDTAKGASHATQYEEEARSALLKVDLSATACNEFSQVVKEIDKLLADNNVKTRQEAWALYPQMEKKINAVANKYGMNLYVNPAPNNKYATVTVNGNPVASTSTGVRQTGFGLGQTVAVAGASAAVLGGAFVVARKKLAPTA